MQDWHPRKKLLAVIKNRKMCQNEDKNPSTEDSAEDSAIQQKTAEKQQVSQIRDIEMEEDTEETRVSKKSREEGPKLKQDE